MPATVPRLPSSSNVFPCVCESPVLTTRPGAADVVAPVDVEAALDPDPVEVCVLVEEPVGVFTDPEPEAAWEGSLLANNIQGVVNVFRAASEAGFADVMKRAEGLYGMMKER